MSAPATCGYRGCSRSLPPAKPTGRRREFCDGPCRQAEYRARRRERRTRPTRPRSDEWETPRELFDLLDREFGFTLDAAAAAANAKCARFFTRRDDALGQEWTGRVFVNPPYGRRIGRWIRKAWEASQTTADVVVCLVPARTDAAWWHDWAARGEIRFLRGRLRFGDAANTAPFPSAVIVFRNAGRGVTKEGGEGATT